MEAIIMEVFKESAITGAFIYLLHHFLGKNANQMERQSDTLEKVSQTLIEVSNKMEDISETIVAMDGRIRTLEERGE